MAVTLTERYISATITSLPLDAQDDVRAELEASIADAIEARLDQGEDPAAAEHAVLTELGDPAALAAGYADRPLHLLGPRYFLTWWRLLKLLLMIVPACAVVGVALAQAIAGASAGEIFGQAIGVGVSATVHMVFWLTLVFVILERTGAETGHKWDLDQLPEPRPHGTGRSDLIASLVLSAAMIGAVLWDRFQGFVRIDGETLQILHPQLWPWAVLGLFAIIAGEAALAVIIYARRRWTSGLAVANTVLAVLWVSWALTALGNGVLVNPELMEIAFPEGGGSPDTIRVVTILFVLTMVGTAVWDIIDGWLKARRDARR